MGITYVGGQVGGRAGSTSTSNVTFALTGGTNSTPQAGDLVVIGCAVGSQGRTPACSISGYTAGTQQNANGTTYDTSLNKSYKFMGGTPDTTFTLPSTGNIADAQRYTVQVWRGVDPTNPFDVADVVATGTATGRPNPGSITPTTSGAFVGIIGAGAAATGAAYTAPANYTTNFLTGTTADTNDAMIGSGYRAWTSGAEDPAGYTGGTTNAADSWASFTYALRPQSAVTHDTTGALVGQGATVAGSVDRLGVEPILISSTALAIGTSATPGAQSITVPSDAQLVVVQASTYAAGGLTLSLASSFAGTFTVTTAGNGSDKCHAAYALVNSTGSQTITPTWSGAVTDGPLFVVSFVKNINTSDFLREALAYNVNTQGSTTSISIATEQDDLLLVLERQAATTIPPATMSGYTSITTQGVNNIGGRVQVCDAPSATSSTLQSSGTEFPGFAAISIKPASGPVTHDTSGALTGQIGSIAGSAAHIAVHGSTGSLSGPGSSVVGSANRFRAHDTSGTPYGQGSALAGSAARSAGAVTHDTTGALSGQGAAVSGAANRFRALLATGALAGPGAQVAGSTNRFRAHSSIGSLTGSVSQVAGISQHNIPHASSGAVAGPGSQVSGIAARTRAHPTVGNLVGDNSTVSSTAPHNVPHASSGVLLGPDSTIVGSAIRSTGFITHDSSGALFGSRATVAGTVNRFRTHASVGSLFGQPGQLSGVAARIRDHSSVGNLVGVGATVLGTSNRYHQFATFGELIGGESALQGTATLLRTHATSGVLAGLSSLISGMSARSSNGANISGETVERLVEIWARLELDASNPVLFTPTQVTVGTITQDVSTAGASRTGAQLLGSADPNQMILEIWQRLGLDPINPVVQTNNSIDFGTIHCEVVTSGDTETVTRT